MSNVVTPQAADLCSYMFSSAKLMLLHEIYLTVPEKKQICLQNHHLFLISSSTKEQLTGSEGNNRLSLRQKLYNMLYLFNYLLSYHGVHFILP